MSYLNIVMLIGNLGNTPEIVKEQDSGYFARLSIAVNKKYTDADGNMIQDTQWHTVYVNNGVGKYAVSYLKKGDKVLISGELRTNKWQDKEGKMHFSTVIYAKECRLIVAKSQEEVSFAEETHVTDTND